MIDSTTRQTVQQLTLKTVTDGAMFTAFDITLLARRQGLQVLDEEVREIVLEMHQAGALGVTYRGALVDVGTPQKVLVYHPHDKNPQRYHSPISGLAAIRSKGLLRRMLDFVLGPPPSPLAMPTPRTAATVNRAASQTPPKQRPEVTLDLGSTTFLPISRDELLKSAQRTSMWGNPWFGRRDLIPPANDERTKLIDRAMVTQGLVTPEELAEIHRVGDQMDRFRPQEIVARLESHRAGAQAVEADRQQQAEAKQAKQAASAQRNAERRAEIAARHANDILFLGRGVSGQLGDHACNIELLQDHGLPILSTAAELATALSLTVSKLRWLAYHNVVASRTHYVRFDIAKRSGGVRSLSSPHKTLAAVQQWILSEILNQLPLEPAAHGFVTGRSILTNASPHVGHEVLINLDLENFFLNITFPRVRHLFKRIGYSPAIATILALLCTESARRAVTYDGKPYLVATGPRGLPQGACTSPMISNQIARRLDRRLQGLATKLNLTYTRYADDLSISGGKDVNERVGYVMACARHIVGDEGFTINAKKTRVLRRNTAQSVTGLITNDKPTPSRAKLRRIRAILHHAKSEGLSAQNRDQHPNFRDWLGGYISFIAMTRPELAKAFEDQLKAAKD